MNTFQQKLYDDLLALVANNEAFYYQDFILDQSTFRIFNYRLASYADFLAPSALECRGIMFEVDGNGNAIRLASLPMEKFFNLNENPSTMNLDFSQVIEIQEKADGSLMSTYLHNGKLRLKSKGSLFSEQALAAMEWLDTQPEFKDVLYVLTLDSWTVNLEWCSPVHRIVLNYPKTQLKVLNARHNHDGHYLPRSSIEDAFYNMKDRLINVINVDDPSSFIASVPNMTNVEGFVVLFASGQRIKVKSNWYLLLHHAKDSINNPRRLFEAVLDENVDDLRSLFYDDQTTMLLIDEMQQRVDSLYNHMVKAVEDFHQANKHLDRKSYAIKGQQDPSLKCGLLSYFGLAMNKYLNKPVRYKEFLKSNWKNLGLEDVVLNKME